MIKYRLKECAGFEWDEHNSRKNWIKHQVTPAECEQVFFNLQLIVQQDTKHSEVEARFYALGKTDAMRLLFVVFTVREFRVRVISARAMSRKERGVYVKQNT